VWHLQDGHEASWRLSGPEHTASLSHLWGAVVRQDVFFCACQYSEEKAHMKFEVLLGKTLSGIVISQDKRIITFETVDGETYRLEHHQDCCEQVLVEDVTGDLADLIGLPLLQAEEVVSPEGDHEPKYDADSRTWTFYKLATTKGSVTLRWLGESNGYYSETVQFTKIDTPPKPD
jgi:hypothetical protein